MNERRRLGVVLPEHELRGHAPLVFERLVKTSRPGGNGHRGVVAVVHALARQAVLRCLPPSARTELGPAFVALEGYLANRQDAKVSVALAKHARIATFAALPVLEQLTLKAVADAADLLPPSKRTELDEHARHTVARFIGLSVHHATSAVCHALDAIQEVEGGSSVPSDACGALAYSRTALGSARNPEFQKAAMEQAAFERARTGLEGTPAGALEIQVFHEYLGARWRAHADEERRASDAFIAWALGVAGTS